MTALATTATPAAPAAGVSGVRYVGSYARRSKRVAGDGRGAHINIADQHAQNRAYAATEYPGVPVREYDDNMSAWNPDVYREGWEQMLTDARHGELVAVIGRYADRLTRQPEQGEQLLTACRKGKAELHTTSSGLITSALMFRIELALAAEESDQKSRRMIDHHRRLEARGAFSGGPRRFGFTDRMTAVDPTEAAEIRKAVTRILAGESIASVTRDWNARGIWTVTGKPWIGRNLGQMLKGPHLAKLRVNRDGVTVAATWDAPAIIDRDTHEAVVRFLADPSRRSTPERQAGRVYALSGLLRCSECGGPCYGRPTGLKSGPAYQCRDGVHAQAPVADVDGTVREMVIERLSTVDAAGVFVDATDRAAAEARRNERDALTGRRAQLPDDYAAGLVDGQQMRAITASIDARIAEIDEAEAAADHAARTPARVLDGLTGHEYDATAGRFDALAPDRQRAVIAVLGTPTLARAARKGVTMWTPERVGFDWSESGHVE